MARFIVKDKQVCMVTWSYVIEAANQEEATEKYVNGEHGEPIGGHPEIGDAVEGYGDGIDVVEIEE